MGKLRSESMRKTLELLADELAKEILTDEEVVGVVIIKEQNMVHSPIWLMPYKNKEQEDVKG